MLNCPECGTQLRITTEPGTHMTGWKSCPRCFFILPMFQRELDA